MRTASLARLIDSDRFAGMKPAPALSAWCDVELDLVGRTLVISSYGLWTAALVESFLSDMAEVALRYAQAGLPEQSLMTTIDLRRHSIQARETIEWLAPNVHRYHYLSKRTAILLSRSALAKLQAERFLTLDRHRFFTSEAAARDWLVSGIEPVA